MFDRGIENWIKFFVLGMCGTCECDCIGEAGFGSQRLMNECGCILYGMRHMHCWDILDQLLSK